MSLFLPYVLISLLKVSDFGLAKNLDADSETDMLPVKWTAPEAIKHKVSYGSFLLLIKFTYEFKTARDIVREQRNCTFRSNDLFSVTTQTGTVGHQN